MKKKSLLKIMVIAGLLFHLISCEELPCEYTNGVQFYMGFYDIEDGVVQDTIIDTLYFRLINDTDSVFIDRITNGVQKYNFPLSMVADSSTLVMEYAGQRFDTLTIFHERLLQMESHACGFDPFFEITNINYTNHQLDSIWISKASVDYAERENIKIYF